MAAKRLTFAYGRTVVIGRVGLLVGLIALVGVSIALTPGFPLLTAGVLAAILIAYGVLFVLSPLLTDHWLTRSRLILRQGWYFRAVIPLADIESASPADDTSRTRIPLGIHRPVGQPTLFVTGGRTGLVSLRLRRPRRFWQSFGLYATEILFDVTDREAFLAGFEERRARGSLAPVEAHRPDPELRD
ncbi:MAG TPA: hypothetical protein VFA17_11135 [Thermoplasmata archaeon]|nr:hypothetical protein [Thermoplasmata archaeon]